MKLKVLHCPTSTGGQAWYLSRAERRLGLQSDVLTLKDHPFGYPSDINLKLGHAHSLTSILKRIRAFRKFRDEYDVFHFNFGTTLIDFPYLGLHYLDLPDLKKRGKRIVVTYQGCDARIRSWCLKNLPDSVCHQEKHWHCSPAGDWTKQIRIRRMARFADHIIALNPDLLPVLPEKAELGFYTITDMESLQPEPFRKDKETFTILHAPSNPRIKGTDAILRAVRELEQEGEPVRMELLRNLDNQEVRKRYREASILIDQLHAGWYGAFAVEGMALGKPVMCAIHEPHLDLIPGLKNDLPLIRTSTRTLKEDLRGLIHDQPRMQRASLEGRRFVEKYHDPVNVAKQLLPHYRGEGPRS